MFTACLPKHGQDATAKTVSDALIASVHVLTLFVRLRYALYMEYQYGVPTKTNNQKYYT
jgi:hypothetical protein